MLMLRERIAEVDIVMYLRLLNQKAGSGPTVATLNQPHNICQEMAQEST